MTTTDTMDTMATVEQAIRMIDAGCEYVRITAQGIREADQLAVIKDELRVRGYSAPLIADIHYQPQAALVAARHVEKVRINPGNYVDRKKGRRSYSDADYTEELGRIAGRMKPLIGACRESGAALRIGSNHGSLSERILLRYGDTPRGMVESALEFVSICREHGFHELVLSMKASNVKVMVQANRLLVRRMLELGMDYPIHLGVTEAGDGEDGRIKSAAGIGPLLMDGIGDTVRVSLTEDPEHEMPVARAIIDAARHATGPAMDLFDGDLGFDPFAYGRRPSHQVGPAGNGTPPVVVVGMTGATGPATAFKADLTPDIVVTSQGVMHWMPDSPAEEAGTVKALRITSEKGLKDSVNNVAEDQLIVLDPGPDSHPADLRRWIRLLSLTGITNPVVLRMDYKDLTREALMIKASVDFSALLVDGLLDGIWIVSRHLTPSETAELSFAILQAAGERISKTEYIACPSCGRTLFDIQATLQEIRKKTSHLKGLKIAVMGCCVNGPGEMADAHYGYVGGARGKITLYKGRKLMKSGIPQADALGELIRLIKENGDWK